MKKFLFLKIFFLALYSPTIFAITCSTGSSGDSATYTWTQVRGASDANGFSGKTGHTSVDFDESLWVIGGSRGAAPTNQVSSSTDGKTWTLVRDSGDANEFPARLNHASVVFDDGTSEKMYVIGGQDDSGTRNDVWSSNDGKTWDDQTSRTATFSVRGYHSAVVFNDGTRERIYVIGGNNGINVLNDVWSSANGKDWTQLTSSATFSARAGHQVVKFNNKLWLTGGFDSNNKKLNDVWSSANGKDWTMETDNAAFPVRSDHAAANFDNKLWVIAGAGNGLTDLTDVWSSTNGKDWKQVEVTDNTGFKGRSGFSSAVSNNGVWILSGRSNTGLITNEVWSISKD